MFHPGIGQLEIDSVAVFSLLIRSVASKRSLDVLLDGPGLVLKAMESNGLCAVVQLVQ